MKHDYLLPTRLFMSGWREVDRMCAASCKLPLASPARLFSRIFKLDGVTEWLEVQIKLRPIRGRWFGVFNPPVGAWKNPPSLAVAFEECGHFRGWKQVLSRIRLRKLIFQLNAGLISSLSRKADILCSDRSTFWLRNRLLLQSDTKYYQFV